jgi:cobalt-zinc-cadmium efflux system protein
MAHGHDHADGHAHGDPDHDHAHAHRDVGTTHGHHGHGHVEKATPSVAAAPSVVEAKEKKQARRLAIVLGLIAAFFFFELFGAKAARSDVLEADAYHLLMDVFAIAVSLLAMRVASARPSDRFTFGLRRAEPVAALLNALLVFGVAVEIVRDSLEHLASPTTPRSSLMLVIATAALCVNGLSAWLLHGAMHGHAGHAHAGHDQGHAHADHAAHAHDDDGHHPHAHHLNMRGAWLHLLGDALGSVAAFSAGLAMKLGAPSFVDPLASFAVVAILVIGAVRLFRDAVLVLLEAAPPRLAVDRVRKVILEHPGVSRVHALHVWSLGTGHDAITAHVHASAPDAGLGMRVAERLRARFAVEYVTVQVDPDRDGERS